jgi:hypothetical protein
MLCLLAVVWMVAAATVSSAAARPPVAAVQLALRAHGFYLGPIDGIYGPLSVRALQRFNRELAWLAKAESTLRHDTRSARLVAQGSAVERCAEGVSAGMSP